ncbi:MAG: hypothetical protein WDW38_009906 [Sanguina aurantia]
MVDQEDVEDALGEIKSTIIEQISTISLRGVRRMLEVKLGVEKGGLDEHKEYISGLMTPIIDAAMAEQPALEAVASPPQNAHATPAPAPVDPAVQTKLEHLKAMCKKAGINIGVNVYSKYKGDPVGQATGIAELLAKHGLRLRSNHSEVMAVRKKLSLQKDLEGIDTTNILANSTGRPKRAAAAATHSRSYKPADTSSSDSDDYEGSRPTPTEAAPAKSRPAATQPVGGVGRHASPASKGATTAESGGRSSSERAAGSNVKGASGAGTSLGSGKTGGQGSGETGGQGTSVGKGMAGNGGGAAVDSEDDDGAGVEEEKSGGEEGRESSEQGDEEEVEGSGSESAEDADVDSGSDAAFELSSDDE